MNRYFVLLQLNLQFFVVRVICYYTQNEAFVEFEANGACDLYSDCEPDMEVNVALQLQDLDLDSVAGSEDDEPLNDVEFLCLSGGLGTCEEQICHRWPAISTLLSYSYDTRFFCTSVLWSHKIVYLF